MADESTDEIPSSGPKIRFRLTQLDTLTVSPAESSSLALRTSPFLPRGHQLYKAPVIRIFGATAAGQRVVAHVHGAMPYFYVQYEAGLDPDTVHSFIRRLGASLNYATAASLGRIKFNKPTDQAKHQYVGYIALCKGIPFYGFHVGYRYFLKIYCLQSKFKKRMAELLRGGKVMSPLGVPRGAGPPGAQSNGFKIFEEHIPFHLQFMLDYNLYGCGWVELSECLFRRPLPDKHLDNGASAPIYLASNISESQFGPLDLKKASYCPVELDCHVSSIMNRHAVKERALHHDFVELLGDAVPDEEKLVQSVKELWEDERRRRQRRGQSGPAEVRDSGPTSQRDYATGEQPAWFTEATFRAQIEDMIRQRQQTAAQKRSNDPSEPTAKFRQFIKPESNLSKLIPTTFQAVEAIHQEKWVKDEEEDNPYGVWAIYGIGIRSIVKSEVHARPEEKHAPQFAEDADVDIDIDVAAIQSQMESYRDDAPEEDADLVRNPDIDDDETEEFDELNWDEDDADGRDLGAPDQSETHPGGSKNVTPRKSKSKMLSMNNQSPAVSPSKRHQQHTHGFQSPAKSRLERHLSGLSPSVARKRELEEQDDGFNQPKAGKMMRFVQRHSDFTSNTNPVMARDFSSPQIAQTVANPSSPDQSHHDNIQGPPAEQISNMRRDSQDVPAASNDHLLLQDLTLSDLCWSQSTQSSLPPSRSKLLTSSYGSACRLSAEPPNGDEEAQKRLDAAILTQTQRSKTERFDVQWYQYSARCPSTDELMKSLSNYDLPMKVYRDPFYSDPADVPERKREYAGRQYTISGSSLRFISEFEHVAKRFGSATPNLENPSINVRRWEFATSPPTLSELRRTMITKKLEKPSNFLLVSQIEGPTQANGGFKYTQIKSKSTAHESQHMDVLAIEVHADSRDDLRPDPSADEIKVLFYCLQSERSEIEFLGRRPNTCLGAIVVDKDKDNSSSPLAPLASMKCALGPCAVEVVDSEIELLNSLIDKVRAWDPEVLTGFELESWSWGYVMRRGRELDFDLVYEFGRVKSESHGRFAGKDDKWGYTHGSSIKVTGRHVLSIWRIIRSEVPLTQYTFENVVYHVLRSRVPHYSFSTLAQWWSGNVLENKRRVMLYYLDRVDLDTQLVDETEMISRNAEISRTLGVDFFSAISRGSQFKVESVLFRIAKPENYMLPSPSREEVGNQNAAECIPLVMEPESAFYKSPLIVLDFQSLYPSVMIAYNYCYSTCLGRAGSFKGINKLGTGTLDLPNGLLELMKDDLIVSPNGMIFAKHHVRKSLLSKMLSEFLDTRVMIKQSMKFIKDDKALTKLLNARQLGLKFIANVTYGYTSASFSGRMPCVEIADAIVQTGRETLEKSMEFIHSVKEWDAKVVYGDTDSLFVYLPGRTREQAFKIGNEMADAITRRNPAPVKLKFEKVYLPCVLMAKKRYVGSKYENLTDTKPEFDAKGIEVIRRDGIPALQKIQETCLKKLFETQDLSEIKAYLYRQWQRLLLGKVSVQDFTFAKEVKLGTYSEKGPPPPGALIAARKMAADPRTEPAYAERVPYVIVKGAPQSRLRDRAVSPETLLQSRLLSLDAEYYITRVFIPSLARIFNLVGADVAGWYQSMPKMMRATKSAAVVESSLVPKELGDKNTLPGETESSPAMENAIVSKSNLTTTTTASKVNKVLVDEHFRSDRCLNCEDEGHQGILCTSCASNPTQVSYSLLARARAFGKRRADLEAICRDCSTTPPSETVECDSLDCSLLYERTKARWLAQDSVKLITAVDHINKGVKLNEVKTLDW